jgi:UTP--glucose-1-phosphate uridylyltransferase
MFLQHGCLLMPRVRKALITAAGPHKPRLSLQSLTDRDGATKPALAIILDEMVAAGIEQIGLLLRPGGRSDYEPLLAPYSERLVYLEQREPRGYGHAVLCGREFIGDEPFLLQVNDHLYVSRGDQSCTAQLLAITEAESCAVSAVQATHESQLRFYGTVGGTLAPGRKGLYVVDNIVEKPSPTVAEQQLVVPGLRHGHYLCFFGMHVLPPSLFALLQQAGDDAKGGTFGLTPTLAALAAREKYLAAELAGRRADLEAPFGLLRAQLALGMHGSSRDEVLSIVAEELALDANRR